MHIFDLLVSSTLFLTAEFDVGFYRMLQNKRAESIGMFP